jgi:c-di-GMP-binding flagellar brake protein YcgR
MKYNGPEKRKFIRITASCTVSYKPEEVDSHHDITFTRDISQGGAIITTDKSFTPGTALAIVIRLPSLPEKIEATVKVVNCREVVKNSIYETRVKFIDLSPQYVQRLGEFVEAKSGGKK